MLNCQICGTRYKRWWLDDEDGLALWRSINSLEPLRNALDHWCIWGGLPCYQSRRTNIIYLKRKLYDAANFGCRRQSWAMRASCGDWLTTCDMILELVLVIVPSPSHVLLASFCENLLSNSQIHLPNSTT